MLVEYPYRNINIPLPSKPLIIGKTDSIEEVSQKLDRYFDDIIRNYPKSTRKFLNHMYYSDSEVGDDIIYKYKFEKKYQKKESPLTINYGNWNISYHTTCDNKIVTYTATFDPLLRECPIIYKISKMHLIATNLGQIHQCIEFVGKDQFSEKYDNDHFILFLEQSAAPAEKILINALPYSVIDRDLKGATSRHVEFIIKHDMCIRRLVTYNDYAQLKHQYEMYEINELVTDDQHSLFYSRTDLQQFRGQKWVIEQYKSFMPSVYNVPIERKYIHDIFHPTLEEIQLEYEVCRPLNMFSNIKKAENKVSATTKPYSVKVQSAQKRKSCNVQVQNLL